MEKMNPADVPLRDGKHSLWGGQVFPIGWTMRRMHRKFGPGRGFENVGELRHHYEIPAGAWSDGVRP